MQSSHEAHHCEDFFVLLGEPVETRPMGDHKGGPIGYPSDSGTYRPPLFENLLLESLFCHDVRNAHSPMEYLGII